MIDLSNISTEWDGTTRCERRIIRAIISRQEKPTAIRYFNQHCSKLGDYWYWFLLGTCWVSYTGYSDLRLWRKLLESKRSNREASLMKPDELNIFRRLKDLTTVYRAHRNNESDWLSYTLYWPTALRFAEERGVDQITQYEIKKNCVLSIFLRRGEYELLVLDPRKALKIREIKIKSHRK